ncbi:class I SAM-dependent methyltransferase [Pullulanibacillus sp. KACC 23026]|uniref:tRNA (mnm(5)s(2)U34)-methyltransferase n=1 Tax=Pullulanibacillus sp. KACC 23026 TaxID=3028315 RepID=UPI0023AECBF9|nr:class I SAM-dependent methyltransferase [Pullulanibacillus sp. KACC 23026]WEG13846.1 class I SAM-dependent methyltransferase [Pullulanibacillus sp. KACC 23026]
MTLRTAVQVAKQLASERMISGGLVVDATAGNGHDTLWLAELVGPTGRVVAFDIQEQAIQQTSKRLEEAKLSQRVTLVHDSHHLALNHLPQEPLDLVLFNLGYLPGGDKHIVTRFDTTKEACISFLSALKPGGLLILVLYPGHPEGALEAEQLEQWAATLDQKRFTAQKIGMLNQANHPPYVIAIEKRDQVNH